MDKGDRISPDENLWRRVYRTDKRYIDPSGRPTSRAFAPRPKDEGKLSVDMARLTTVEKAIADAEKFKLYSIPSKLVFDLGLDCLYDPLTVQSDGVDNPAHCLVTGFEPDDERVPGILARQAVPVESI
jgi:hypothetical protein